MQDRTLTTHDPSPLPVHDQQPTVGHVLGGRERCGVATFPRRIWPANAETVGRLWEVSFTTGVIATLLAVDSLRGRRSGVVFTAVVCLAGLVYLYLP